MRSAAVTFSLYDIFLYHITTGKTNHLLKYKFSKNYILYRKGFTVKMIRIEI